MRSSSLCSRSSKRWIAFRIATAFRTERASTLRAMDSTTKLRRAGMIMMGLGFTSMIIIPAHAYTLMTSGAHNWRVSFGLEVLIFLLGAAAFDQRNIARK